MEKVTGFWRELHGLNKISAVILVFFVVYFAILRVMMMTGNESSLMNTMVNVGLILYVVLPTIGVATAIIGWILGLSGRVKLQTKISIGLFAANLIVPTVLVGMDSIM